ncbi:MAG TPA: type IV conjugative transfer system protein TraL [Aigarchaeota archaeon]|nr:type IV conjugative transfer system protein TraL [Aigarchaeota archaeon]
MAEEKIRYIPRYLDEDYKVIGIIPVDTLVVFALVFGLLLWPLGHLKSFLIAAGSSFLYWKSVKKKGRGYWKLLLFKLGFLKVTGAMPPTEGEVRR